MILLTITILVWGIELPEKPHLALQEILFEETGVSIPWDEGRIWTYRGEGSTWNDLIDKKSLFELLQNTDSVHAIHSKLLPLLDIDIVKTHPNGSTQRNQRNSLNNPQDSYRKGYTVILHNLDMRHAGAHKKCHFISKAFMCPSSTSVTITPSDSQGLGKHHHKHDVFIIQIKGSKTWHIYDHPENNMLPRSDQAKERFVDSPLSDSFKQIEEIQLEEGNILYIPRGVPAQGDTRDLDGESLHITVSIECASYRLIWEDLLHHVISVGCSRQDDYGVELKSHSYCFSKIEELDHNQYSEDGKFEITHWELKNKSLFHSLIRIISDVNVQLRKSIVGLNTKSMIKYYVKYIIPVLQSVTKSLSAEDCTAANLKDVRLLTWLKSGMVVTDTEGVPVPVGIESPLLQHAITLVQSHIADLTIHSSLRHISHSRQLFWDNFISLATDPEYIEIAAEQLRDLRSAAFHKQQSEAKEHLLRQQLKDGDRDIFW